MAYVLLIQSELYRSSSSIIIKDINSNQVSEFDLSLFGVNSTSQMQDSKVIETYLSSHELLEKINDKFSLRKHYESNKVDLLDRLSQSDTKEEFLELYLQRIEIQYDELSGILHIGFLHTDPNIAKKILEYILKAAEDQINIYNQQNAKKYLAFAKESVDKNKISLDNAINELEKYQNKNLVLDPTSSAESKSAIISSLEADLVKKNAYLQQIKSYMSGESFEVKNLQTEIESLEKSLKNTKSTLTGQDDTRLNLILFDYEKLKNQVEFDKEKYKQSLVQYEIAKNELDKDAKTLQIVVNPNLPDGYSVPNKPKSLIDIIIVLGLLFGITSLIIAIIKDHKD
jgi:capsular polysaccharide transport system permease protein